MDFTGIFAIFCALIGIPSIVFGFILINNRGKRNIEALRLKKEMLQLEIEKERTQIRLLEAENRKYDRLIEGGFDSIAPKS